MSILFFIQSSPQLLKVRNVHIGGASEHHLSLYAVLMDMAKIVVFGPRLGYGQLQGAISLTSFLFESHIVEL